MKREAFQEQLITDRLQRLVNIITLETMMLLDRNELETRLKKLCRYTDSITLELDSTKLIVYNGMGDVLLRYIHELDQDAYLINSLAALPYKKAHLNSQNWLPDDECFLTNMNSDVLEVIGQYLTVDDKRNMTAVNRLFRYEYNLDRHWRPTLEKLIQTTGPLSSIVCHKLPAKQSVLRILMYVGNERQAITALYSDIGPVFAKGIFTGYFKSSSKRKRNTQKTGVQVSTSKGISNAYLALGYRSLGQNSIRPMIWIDFCWNLRCNMDENDPKLTWKKFMADVRGYRDRLMYHSDVARN